jgi:hypothetical protein
MLKAMCQTMISATFEIIIAKPKTYIKIIVVNQLFTQPHAFSMIDLQFRHMLQFDENIEDTAW